MADFDFNLIRQHLARRRKYAPFFEASSKTGKEFSVAATLCEALAKAGEPSFKNLRPATKDMDPPDCVAYDASGRPVAIEVTELVSSEAVRACAKGQSVYYDWEPTEFVALLDGRVRDKDAKKYKGGPFARIVVLVHCAEPILDSTFVTEALQHHFLPMPTQVSEAFLLLKYEGGLQRYPWFRLRFAS